MKKAILVITGALSVAACGGGHSTGSTAPPQNFDLQAAMAAYEKSASSVPVTLSGTVVVNGTPVAFSGTGTYTAAAGNLGNFANAAALLQTVSISGTLSAAGQSLPYSSSVVDAFDPSTGDMLGQSESSEYDVATAPIVIPPSVGSSPVVLGTLNRYSDSSLSVAIGTVQISVALVRAPIDPGSAEVVQFTFDIFDSGQQLIEVDTYSYNLDGTATLSFSAASAQTSGGTVQVTAQ